MEPGQFTSVLDDDCCVWSAEGEPVSKEGGRCVHTVGWGGLKFHKRLCPNHMKQLTSASPLPDDTKASFVCRPWFHDLQSSYIHNPKVWAGAFVLGILHVFFYDCPSFQEKQRRPLRLQLCVPQLMLNATELHSPCVNVSPQLINYEGFRKLGTPKWSHIDHWKAETNGFGAPQFSELCMRCSQGHPQADWPAWKLARSWAKHFSELFTLLFQHLHPFWGRSLRGWPLRLLRPWDIFLWWICIFATRAGGAWSCCALWRSPEADMSQLPKLFQKDRGSKLAGWRLVYDDIMTLSFQPPTASPSHVHCAESCWTWTPSCSKLMQDLQSAFWHYNDCIALIVRLLSLLGCVALCRLSSGCNFQISSSLKKLQYRLPYEDQKWWTLFRPGKWTQNFLHGELERATCVNLLPVLYFSSEPEQLVLVFMAIKLKSSSLQCWISSDQSEHFPCETPSTSATSGQATQCNVPWAHQQRSTQSRSQVKTCKSLDFGLFCVSQHGVYPLNSKAIYIYLYIYTYIYIYT